MKVHVMRAYIEPTPVPKMPAGLVELMEGLSREVLKNNPSEVYTFCAQHMRNLLVLRDGKTPVKYLTLEQKINKANKAIQRRAAERRQNFDNNMRLQGNTEEQSFGDGMKIAAIVTNANNLNTKEDSELREEKDETLLNNVKNDNNLDIGTHIIDNEHKTTNKSEVKKDNCNSGIETKHHANDNVIMNNPVFVTSIDAPNNSQVVKQENIIDVKLKVEQDINDDESDKPICTNGEENDSEKIVQVLAIAVEKEVNPDHVSNNIKINEVSNVEICELDIDEINVKEENESKLNNDPQSISKVEAEQNNILIALEGNEQNLNVSGDNIKETIIVTTSDSLKDSKSNNDVIEDNSLQEKYNNEIQYTTNDVIKPNVTDTNAKKEVDIIISEKTDDMNKETIIDTDKSQNQTNVTKIVEKNSQISNLNTKQIDTETIIMTVDNVADNVNKKQDETTNKLLFESTVIDKASDGMSHDNMIKVALISEKEIDKITDCSTDIIEINNDKTKVYSDKTKLINDQKDDLVINIESEQQDQDNKNDRNCNHDNSQLLIKEPNDTESKNSNVPETDKLKGSKPMDLETAAITIQKVFRNFLFRSKTSSFEEPSNIEMNMFGRVPDTKDESDFTLRNQNKERRVMGISRMDTVLQTVNEEKSLSLSTDDSSTISSAATVIQSHIRGFLCRNRLSGNKVTSSTSLNTSKDSSPVPSEDDPALVKNKTVLNIHIVPESGQFVSRDESIINSMELSLDGSPPTSANLHPLGYDKSERRKQLKREDAIQSISPPSNNSRLSEEQDSVKEVIDNEVENDKAEKSDSEMPVNSERGVDQQEHIKDVLIAGKVEAANNVDVTQPPDSQISITIFNDTLQNDLSENYFPEENLRDVTKQSKDNKIVKEVYIEENTSEIEKNDGIHISNDSQNIPICNNDAPKVIGEIEAGKSVAEQKSVNKVLDGKEIHQQLESEQKVDTQINISTPHDNIKEKDKAATEISDELDVVTPFTRTEEPKLLHSGEFHDVVVPTKVSRSDTSVVSDFHNVLVYFLVWNN